MPFHPSDLITDDDSTDSDLCSVAPGRDDRPSAAKKRKIIPNQNKSSNEKYAAYMASDVKNVKFITAAAAICPDKMVTLAVQNIKNYDNIRLLEWSEYVVIQLCTIKKEIDPTWLWPQIMAYVENHQWVLPVIHNLAKYMSSNITLLAILEKNHEYKVARLGLDDHLVFITSPMINYSVLKTYKLTHDAIQPLVNSRMPSSFKKPIRRI